MGKCSGATSRPKIKLSIPLISNFSNHFCSLWSDFSCSQNCDLSFLLTATIGSTSTVGHVNIIPWRKSLFHRNRAHVFGACVDKPLHPGCPIIYFQNEVQRASSFPPWNSNFHRPAHVECNSNLSSNILRHTSIPNNGINFHLSITKNLHAWTTRHSYARLNNT